MKKVYLVVEKFASDYENGIIIKSFSTYEKARKYFNNTINDYKKDDMLFDTIEKNENSFSTYDIGYYSQNHNDLEIIESECE